MDRKQCIETTMRIFEVPRYMAKQLANECEKAKVPYEIGIECMKESVIEETMHAILYGDDTWLYGHGDPNKIPNGILSVLKNEGYKEGGK